ncbi:DMT family transporter [Kiloniella antarctica]|uniref:DMT family transporter n=1 Tax=Kiloniella antarctica TaxID=1550907 RepID=A0ABW5BM57_9PROT
MQFVPERVSTYWLDNFLPKFLGRWEAMPGNIRGAILVLLATFSGAVMGALIKVVGQRIPVFEILFIRQLFALILLSPVIIRSGPDAFKTSVWKLYLLRGVFSFVAMSAGFTAVVYMPLAEVTAIGFVRTLFTTLLAIVFLHEVVGIRRWSVTIIGFIGVLIIVRPDADGLNIYAVMALVSAFFVAAIMVILRKLSQIDKPSTIMMYQSILITLFMMGPAIWYWQEPTLNELIIIVTIAALLSAMQWFYIQAYRVAEAVTVAQVEYVRLLFATGIGVMFFSEIPTLWTLGGASIIIASTFYTVHRSAVRKKEREKQPEVQ